MAGERIAVIGLGYVGLPLAVALARHHAVVGYDIDPARVGELRRGADRTGTVDAAALAGLTVSERAEDLAGCTVFIVTVPTPVDDRSQPDLGALRGACATVGKALTRGAVVVFESTVYPGVTEQICGPALAAASGLTPGKDFFLGYSPERINPGDRAHGVEHIVKVVAGQTPDVAQQLARLYGTINGGQIFVARDIRTAEAAKVIENAQRDINVAFINEVAMILGRLGLSVFDVIETARTKWNFLPFQPGLVGGHCIGVDPYYLAHCALEAGHNPEVVLAGRRINDAMGWHIADEIARTLAKRTKAGPLAPILVLGLTFKENIRDLRNSRVVDLVRGLARHGHPVTVHDPWADPAEARALYDLEPLDRLPEQRF
ncbi:MAG: nucleotide sugar dehydrogenase, partial [Alphaproteobacteria bacterium]|nr:nucleotide sugar dehydrogenase [Alphaproteobacteria bacterium]